jgi:uncharacterized protein (DUF2249 family)
MSLPITPETRISDLLEAYPGIEEQLIARVPRLAKLRNPVLRETVARVATVERAAHMGGLATRDLVLDLRRAAGQDNEPPVSSDAPAWLDPARVRLEIDADAMLATGEHPVGKVRQSMANLESGEILQLTSSFRPTPLIDLMQKGGAQVYSAETEPGRFATWFCRP